MENIGFELYELENFKKWQAGDEDNSQRIERLRRNLTKAMDELTPLQRQQVEMYYFRHMPQGDIARELGVNKATVSRGLKRARCKLKRFLQFSL